MSLNGKNQVYGSIYRVTNLVNGKVYIGQTVKKKPIDRWKNHIWCAFKGGYTFRLHQALRKHGKENFKFEVIDTASDVSELNALEKSYIAENDSLKKGYNMTVGGSSFIPEKNKKPRTYGRPHSKTVLQYSLDGELVAEHESTVDAAKASGLHRINIGQCCRGQSLTAGGYRWAYKSNDGPSIEEQLNNRKRYNIHNKRGELLESFFSVTEMCKKYNLLNNKISDCLYGRALSHRGYTFSVENK